MRDISKVAEMVPLIDNVNINEVVAETREWLSLLGERLPMDQLAKMREDCITVFQCLRRGPDAPLHRDDAAEVMILCRDVERQMGFNAKRYNAEGKWLPIGLHADGRPSFQTYVSANTASAAYRWAAASDEEWAKACAEARERQEAGMKNMYAILEGRPEKKRNPRSDEILLDIIGQLEGAMAGLTIAHPQDVSPEVAEEFSAFIKTSMREISRFIKEL